MPGRAAAAPERPPLNLFWAIALSAPVRCQLGLDPGRVDRWIRAAANRGAHPVAGGSGRAAVLRNDAEGLPLIRVDPLANGRTFIPSTIILARAWTRFPSLWLYSPSRAISARTTGRLVAAVILRCSRARFTLARRLQCV